MDIGTGIIVGCTILGGTATVFKIFGNKRPENKSIEKKFEKVVFIDTCKAYRNGQEKQFDMLKEVMQNGFKEVNKKLDKL